MMMNEKRQEMLGKEHMGGRRRTDDRTGTERERHREREVEGVRHENEGERERDMKTRGRDNSHTRAGERGK